MKRILFTLMMIAALAMVANTAKAQNETSVYPGGTYTYNLTGILSHNAATAAVTYSGSNATITELTGSYAIAATIASTVSFTIFYDDTPLATSGNINVTITDGTSTCANNILLAITVLDLPTYTLALTKDETGFAACQARSGAGDNTADAMGTDIITEVNTFTFTVTPTLANLPSEYDFTYIISLPGGGTLQSFADGSSSVTGFTSGTVSRDETDVTDGHVYTVTFNTTTGINAVALTATLTLAGSNLTLPAAHGSGVYAATAGGDLTQTVTVSAVPSIGSFQ